MKINIPDRDGGNVISITAVMESQRLRRIRDRCPHSHVTVDDSQQMVTCDDCGESISAVWFLLQIVERWSSLERSTKSYNEAAARYAEKTRTKCQHCGAMTRIVRPPRLAREGGEG